MVEPLRHRQSKEADNRYVRPTATAPHLDFTIRVAPTGSKASPNVRYAFNSDRICASQRTDANGMDRPCSRPGTAQRMTGGLEARGAHRHVP